MVGYRILMRSFYKTYVCKVYMNVYGGNRE